MFFEKERGRTLFPMCVPLGRFSASDSFARDFEELAEERTEHLLVSLEIGGGYLRCYCTALAILLNVLTVRDATDTDDLNVLREKSAKLPDLSETDRLHRWSGESSKATTRRDSRLRAVVAERVREGVHRCDGLRHFRCADDLRHFGKCERV